MKPNLTVSELKAELERLEEAGHGGDGVTVETWGVLAGGNVQVTGVGVGFDWTSGQAVIETSKPIRYWEKKPKKHVKE